MSNYFWFSVVPVSSGVLLTRIFFHSSKGIGQRTQSDSLRFESSCASECGPGTFWQVCVCNSVQPRKILASLSPSKFIFLSPTYGLIYTLFSITISLTCRQDYSHISHSSVLHAQFQYLSKLSREMCFSPTLRGSF